MWGQLGDIVFETPKLTPKTGGFRASLQWEYAEHKVIEGKALLQYMGESLEEIELEIRLYYGFCDPDAEEKSIIEAARKHEPLTFVLGTGDIVGDYVIERAERTRVETHKSGQTLVLEMSLTLKECPKEGERDGGVSGDGGAGGGLAGGAVGKAVAAAGVPGKVAGKAVAGLGNAIGKLKDGVSLRDLLGMTGTLADRIAEKMGELRGLMELSSRTVTEMVQGKTGIVDGILGGLEASMAVPAQGNSGKGRDILTRQAEKAVSELLSLVNRARDPVDVAGKIFGSEVALDMAAAAKRAGRS